jgi:hypothetical protein
MALARAQMPAVWVLVPVSPLRSSDRPAPAAWASDVHHNIADVTIELLVGGLVQDSCDDSP